MSNARQALPRLDLTAINAVPLSCSSVVYSSLTSINHVTFLCCDEKGLNDSSWCQYCQLENHNREGWQSWVRRTPLTGPLIFQIWDHYLSSTLSINIWNRCGMLLQKCESGSTFVGGSTMEASSWEAISRISGLTVWSALCLGSLIMETAVPTPSAEAPRSRPCPGNLLAWIAAVPKGVCCAVPLGSPACIFVAPVPTAFGSVAKNTVSPCNWLNWISEILAGLVHVSPCQAWRLILRLRNFGRLFYDSHSEYSVFFASSLKTMTTAKLICHKDWSAVIRNLNDARSKPAAQSYWHNVH